MDFITLKLVQHKHFGKYFVFWFLLLMVIQTDMFPVFFLEMVQSQMKAMTTKFSIFLDFPRPLPHGNQHNGAPNSLLLSQPHLHWFILAFADTEG